MRRNYIDTKPIWQLKSGPSKVIERFEQKWRTSYRFSMPSANERTIRGDPRRIYSVCFQIVSLSAFPGDARRTLKPLKTKGTRQPHPNLRINDLQGGTKWKQTPANTNDGKQEKQRKTEEKQKRKVPESMQKEGGERRKDRKRDNTRASLFCAFSHILHERQNYFFLQAFPILGKPKREGRQIREKSSDGRPNISHTPPLFRMRQGGTRNRRTPIRKREPKIGKKWGKKTEKR